MAGKKISTARDNAPQREVNSFVRVASTILSELLRPPCVPREQTRSKRVRRLYPNQWICHQNTCQG